MSYLVDTLMHSCQTKEQGISTVREIDNEGEKVFEHLTKFPAEIRMMIVNKMAPDDRCRYARSSHLCNAEAKSSKNYIYSLSFLVHSPVHIDIDIKHGDPEDHSETGYILQFILEYDNIYMIYKTRDDKQMWWVWKSSSNLRDSALKRFKELMNLHQNGVKMLSIESKTTEIDMNVDFGITSMKMLEELRIDGNFDYLQFISKVHHPFKTLYVAGNTFYKTPIQQVYEAPKILLHHELRLNNEKFLRLSASIVHIHIGELTVEDVFNFIQSWQNGTIERKIEKVIWQLQDSDFDVPLLFRLFGRKYSGQMKAGWFKTIKHHEDAGKHALLSTQIEVLRITFHDDE